MLLALAQGSTAVALAFRPFLYVQLRIGYGSVFVGSAVLAPTDRRVEEGEKIGVVSNYLDYPNGTTRHLHFDVQVFTRDGWLWVNPYVTLISAYERLIGGRGHEIGPEQPPSPAMAHAMPLGAVRPEMPNEGADN